MTTDPEKPQPIRFRAYKIPKGIDLKRYQKFVFSISVGAPNQSVAKVVEAFHWAQNRYGINLLLIGDSLYKITARICEGLSQLEAEAKAIKAGNELLKEYSDNLNGNFSILRTSDLIGDPEFSNAFMCIDRLFKDDVSFRESVVSDARSYVERQRSRGTLKIPEEEGISLSIFYLKQEIAIYLLLADQGWLADLYLGQEIPTLQKIMTGEFPAAPDALKQRAHITLEIKKRKQVPQFMTIPKRAATTLREPVVCAADAVPPGFSSMQKVA